MKCVIGTSWHQGKNYQVWIYSKICYSDSHRTRQHWIIEYSDLSDGTYWPKLSQVIFCYCSYMGLYNKSEEYSTWLSPLFAGSEVIWVLVCFFWSFVVQEVDGEHKGSEDTTVDVHTSGSLFEYVPEIRLFHWSGFLLVKKQNFQSGDYSSNARLSGFLNLHMLD